jgi:hypothetical protein
VIVSTEVSGTPFTIVFSNYTGSLFAWSGTPKENQKYLGNRAILGTVNALSSTDALNKWRTEQLQLDCQKRSLTDNKSMSDWRRDSPVSRGEQVNH